MMSGVFPLTVGCMDNLGVQQTVTAEALPVSRAWQGVMPGLPIAPPSYCPPVDFSAQLRDAKVIGFLLGVLEGLRFQVSDELGIKIDSALARAKELQS